MTARLLEGLLDPCVETEEVDPFRDPIDELLPEEAHTIANGRDARLLEFRAGRHCARTALGRLGAPAGPLLRSEDRSPIWPAGFVGSITHTRGGARAFCGAAVARSSEVHALGIDAEFDTPLERALFRRILTEVERAWISDAAESDQPVLAKRVFSAKEAVYKCQYPLSRTFLEFADVELAPFTGTTFTAMLRKRAPPFGEGHTFTGRQALRSGLVVSAVAIAARTSVTSAGR